MTGPLFIAPAGILLTLVVIVPLVFGVVMSLDVGDRFALGNYMRLAQDPRARQALRASLQFTGISVAGHVIVGLTLAQLLNAHLFVRRLWRMVLLVPWIISPVISGVLWKWMFDPLYGVVNDWLFRLKIISDPILWLEKPGLALASVTVGWIWTGFPFVMVMALAGLQQIPEEQYEAATCDGATRVQLFRFIVLPNLGHVLAIAALLDTIQSFRAFSSVYVMTEGGPGSTTAVASIFVYKQAFHFLQFEYASAAAVLMGTVLLALGLLYTRLVA